MTRTSWAGLGALAALLALPASVQATDDGQINSPRTRRTSVVRVVNPAPETTVGATQRREQVQLPEGVPSPSLPTFEDTSPVSMDHSLELGPLHEALAFHVLDAPLLAPRLPSELQARIRAELANLHVLDLPVGP